MKVGIGDTFFICSPNYFRDSPGVVSFHNHHRISSHFFYFDVVISRLRRPSPFFSAPNAFFLFLLFSSPKCSATLSRTTVNDIHLVSSLGLQDPLRPVTSLSLFILAISRSTFCLSLLLCLLQTFAQTGHPSRIAPCETHS